MTEAERLALRKYNREYRRANPQKTYDREKARATKRAWKQRNAEKVRAQTAVSNAIRDGRLVRPEHCEIEACELRPQAHHDDYTKPFDVRWLCAAHHAEHHVTLREQQEA